jgi:hypothetical protein
MGKSTISMVIFNSYVSHYQRVNGVPNVPTTGPCDLRLFHVKRARVPQKQQAMP